MHREHLHASSQRIRSCPHRCPAGQQRCAGGIHHIRMRTSFVQSAQRRHSPRPHENLFCAPPPQVPFISGIEVFERGHRTTPHVHPHAHELFFILAGEGTGFCGDHRFSGKDRPAPPAGVSRPLRILRCTRHLRHMTRGGTPEQGWAPLCSPTCCSSRLQWLPATRLCSARGRCTASTTATPPGCTGAPGARPL